MDLMLQVKEQAGSFTRIILVHQNSTALHQLAILFQHEVDGGVEKRTSGANQLGSWLLINIVLIKTDALVAFTNWRTHPNLPVSSAQRDRDAGDLPPS